MAASFAAALLDELMGRNRDVNPAEKRKTHWSDPEVCKFFLCGFCPHYLFTNTRADLGRCNKIHDEDFRASYQKSQRFEKMGYEREFAKFLQDLISEVDKRIRRGEQRLILNSQPNPVPMTPQMAAREKRIEGLTQRISELVEEAESLGCEGNVDQAQNVMVLCEQMRDERTTLLGMNEADHQQLEYNSEQNKAMEVCTTCGALLIIGDAQQRLEEHVMGKQHMGYARIRSYLEGQQLVPGSAPGEPAIQLDDDDTEPSAIKISDTGSVETHDTPQDLHETPEHTAEQNSDRHKNGQRREKDASRTRERDERSGGSTSSRHRSRSRERVPSSSHSSSNRDRKHRHSSRRHHSRSDSDHPLADSRTKYHS